MELTDAVYRERVRRARNEMDERGVDALLLSNGADLPYLVGYQAMALERLTMLVLTADDAQLVIPAFEAARVTRRDDEFDVMSWTETEDPIGMVGRLLSERASACVGDTTWARFVIDLMRTRPDLDLRRSNEVMTPMRAVKDSAEVDALRAAAHAADVVAADLQTGRIPLIGRCEAEVSADLGRRLLEAMTRSTLPSLHRDQTRPVPTTNPARE